MKVVSMSESRANYAATLDSVINDQEEVVITRPGGENVVMLPQREYESMRETLYLMASPANRRRISRSIEQLNDGGGRKLAELDEQIARAQAVREAIRHGLLCPALRALRSRISDDGVVNIFHGHADKVVQPRDVHGDLHIG